MLAVIRSARVLQRRLIHTSQKSFPRVCPSCSQPLPSPLPVCNKCWHISPLSRHITFHDILGLPSEPNPFVIDVSLLKQRFREAQALCHPDTWTSKGPEKQDTAQAISARVNEAYQALLKPLPRAEYILGQHHIPISEKDQVDDIEFMSEVMEAREIIDDAEDESEVVNLVKDNREKIEQTVKDLEGLVGDARWDDAKAAAIRLRYLEGIERAGNRWLEHRG